MKWILPLFLAACSAHASAASAAAHAPVIVELFTSEGCSSCPPADALLAKLARDPNVLALELHVDYWNDLGWADPFSSAAFSARQSDYAGALGGSGVYTPEMIVDGAVGFVGSDADRARKEIAAAGKRAHVAVTIARKGDDLTITAAAPGESADVLLAITESDLSSKPTRGENNGKTLAHGPVVRSLVKLATIDAAWTGKQTLTIDPSWKGEHLHAVVFVQSTRTRAIFGAAVQ